jgi:hypothetical protein
MSQQFQCISCKGVYFDQQLDGTVYFHVCPRLPRNDRGQELQREGHRDENVDVTPRGRVKGIKAAGAGVVRLSDRSNTPPEWITLLEARVARAEAE